MILSRPSKIVPRCLFILLPLLAFAAIPGLAQQITLGNGSQVFFGNNALQIENPLSQKDRTIILTPQEGKSLATAEIKKGTHTTRISGKKIVYVDATSYLLVEGNARIELGKEILTAPVKIEFDPKTNIMTLYGTSNHPATIHSSSQDTFNGKAEKWLLYFQTQKDGNRKLVNIKAPKTTQAVLIPKK